MIKSEAMAFDDKPWEQFEAKTANAVVEILSSYRLDTSSYDADDVKKSNALAFTQALNAIKENKPVPLALPAFPFKSPNATDKVLGVLPDKAEEVSLAVLQSLCSKIGQVYKHGARLVIISDGIVYNGKTLGNLIEPLTYSPFRPPRSIRCHRVDLRRNTPSDGSK